MVLGEYYDTSLYYMLKANDKRTRDIKRFLFELPEELIEKIRTLNVQSDGKRHYSSNIYVLDERMDFRSKDEPNVVYTLLIHGNDLSVLINKKRFYNYGKFTREFQLLIFPFSVTDANDLAYKNFHNRACLGCVITDFLTKFKGNTETILDCRCHDFYLNKQRVLYTVSVYGRYGDNVPRPVRIRKNNPQLNIKGSNKKRLVTSN